ncbi:regulatory protein RecX [Anaerovibrio sp. RM50]|uniref:regulatory protein RecX n=1 Tax=Anaerovibrio sp. RM50 TaxID=1200557 RepID=UPI00048028EF|nr:regulatory protein RecX [Anaerovibrio sp. RM50]
MNNSPSRAQNRPKPSAKAKAVDLLSRSDQSVRRLTEKLARKDYSEEEIQETIEWLQEKHYVDDEAGCKRRFEYLYESSGYSVKQICAKLMQKGYDSSLVRSCVPDDIYDRELEKAGRVVRSKFKPGADFRKMQQYLYGKGFDYSAARDAIEDYRQEWPEEEE